MQNHSIETARGIEPTGRIDSARGIKTTRRALVVTGGLGVIGAVAGSVGMAHAAPQSSSGGDNIKLVTDFCNSWDDPARSVTFLTPDASVRMVEDQPAVVGPAAVAAAFKSFMGHGETISVKILTSHAEGPIVINKRIDTMKTPGKPDQAFKVVGVFTVKGGKIKEWSDYLDT